MERQKKLDAVRKARRATGHRGIRNAYKSLEGMDGVSVMRTREMLNERDKGERNDRELDSLIEKCDMMEQRGE